MTSFRRDTNLRYFSFSTSHVPSVIRELQKMREAFARDSYILQRVTRETAHLHFKATRFTLRFLLVVRSGRYTARALRAA